MKHASLTRIRQLAPVALVLLSSMLAAAVYLQTLDFGFISDDTIYLTNNPRLLGLRLGELWRLFTEPYNGYSEFLPLRELSYWFDFALFGLTPAAFRLHNIILYALCLPLVYGATSGLWRYFRPADATGTSWAAAGVTALFALHPALAESVVYISGRKDLLSALFSLLALWLAVSARREHGLSAPHAIATLLALLAALLSKASAFAVAPVIALLWVLFWRDVPAPGRRRSQLLWPFAILVLAACIVLFFAAVITTRVPFYFGFEAVTRAMAILGWLARLAISPESRHSFYPVFEDPALPVMAVLGAAVLAAASAACVVTLLRRRSLEGFALSAFFLLCLPSLQLVPYAPSSLVADRFLVLAIWPAILLVVALSSRLKPIHRTVLMLAIALPWGLHTFERSRELRSFEVMVDADIRAHPGYYVPAVYKIGDILLPRRLYSEASVTANGITVPEFREMAVKLVAADYAVHVEAASAGNPEKAMVLLKELGLALKQLPVQAKWNTPMQGMWRYCQFGFAMEWNQLASLFSTDASVRFNAGIGMLEAHIYNRAATHLRAAIESSQLQESLRGTAFKNLGLALLNSGHVADAETPLRAALEQSPPDLLAYCLLSKVYKQTNRLAEAARAEASCPAPMLNEESAR